MSQGSGEGKTTLVLALLLAVAVAGYDAYAGFEKSSGATLWGIVGVSLLLGLSLQGELGAEKSGGAQRGSPSRGPLENMERTVRAASKGNQDYRDDIAATLKAAARSRYHGPGSVEERLPAASPLNAIAFDAQSRGAKRSADSYMRSLEAALDQVESI